MRAREGRSEQAGAAPISFSPIRWRGGAINRTIDVDLPLPSYGVGFGNTRFAAALRLGC